MYSSNAELMNTLKWYFSNLAVHFCENGGHTANGKKNGNGILSGLRGYVNFA